MQFILTTIMQYDDVTYYRFGPHSWMESFGQSLQSCYYIDQQLQAQYNRRLNIQELNKVLKSIQELKNKY